MRVAHVISQTGTYGGERFVPALVQAERAAGIDACIVTGCSRKRIFALAQTLRDLRPDIVHTHLAHAKYWGRIAAILAGVPHIVHTEHGNDFRAPLPLRAIGRALQFRTDRVVALTRAQATRIARYERIPFEKIAIIANGIELGTLQSAGSGAARAELGGTDGGRIVLAVGRLDAVKRYDRAIESLALLPRSANVHLSIAGDGRERSRLARIAAERGVGDRVHLLGYRDDVPALLGAADVVLNTSESEAMPLSLIEALCSGVRVVTTPWPGAIEIFAADAAVVPDFQPQSIAVALETALDAGALPAQRVSALRERFSIDRAAASYAAVYAELDDRVRGHGSVGPGVPCRRCRRTIGSS